MKTSHRKSSQTRSRRQPRAAADATKARYENAWDESVPYQDPAPGGNVWLRLRRFSATRTGRVVMLASAGTLGAYVFFRRRR